MERDQSARRRGAGSGRPCRNCLSKRCHFFRRTAKGADGIASETPEVTRIEDRRGSEIVDFLRRPGVFGCLLCERLMQFNAVDQRRFSDIASDPAKHTSILSASVGQVIATTAFDQILVRTGNSMRPFSFGGCAVLRFARGKGLVDLIFQGYASAPSVSAPL